MSDITRDYSFGGWLRFYRLRKNMTLREAAKSLGMDPGNLSKLERSELSPPRASAVIQSIGQTLDLTGSDVMILVTAAFSFHVGQLRKDFE